MSNKPTPDFLNFYLVRALSVVPAHTITDGACSCRQLDCESPGKHPRVQWQEFQKRLADEAEVARWWTRRGWESSNVAVVTGSLSGVVVLDIDLKNRGDDSLAEFEREHGELPPTWQVVTGGGGSHFYFAHPGERLPNAANLRPGIDLRGDGGYVIAPPSVHASGRQYEWAVDGHPDDVDLAPLPASVRDLAAQRPRSYGARVQPSLDFDAISDGRAVVSEGERNEVMAKYVGHLCATRAFGDVADLARGANLRSFDPPLGESELERIIASITQRHAAQRDAQDLAARSSNGTVNYDDITPEERLAAAASIWGEYNVRALTDWYAVRGADEISYYVVTPEAEIPIGTRLLDYNRIRNLMMDVGGELMPSDRGHRAEWPVKAAVLRRLVREEVSEPLRAVERIEDWIEQYSGRYGALEVDVEERRDAIGGRPILIDGVLHIRPAHLRGYLEAQLGEQVQMGELRRLLKRAGWAPVTVRSGDSTLRAWRAP